MWCNVALDIIVIVMHSQSQSRTWSPDVKKHCPGIPQTWGPHAEKHCPRNPRLKIPTAACTECLCFNLKLTLPTWEHRQMYVPTRIKNRSRILHSVTSERLLCHFKQPAVFLQLTRPRLVNSLNCHQKCLSITFVPFLHLVSDANFCIVYTRQFGQLQSKVATYTAVPMVTLS